MKQCQFCGKSLEELKPYLLGTNWKQRKYCSRICMGKAFSKDRTGVERGPNKKKYTYHQCFRGRKHGKPVFETIKI